MNASLMARTAYTTAPAAIKTAKAAEYDIFAKATTALKSARTFPEKAKAIADNRRLWTCLAVDVAHKENALPAALKARIFYLSEFVAHQSSKSLQTDEGIETLVDLNLTVMSGLRHQGPRE